MGLFSNIREKALFAQLDRVVEAAERSGLYEGTHMENS